MHKFTVLMLILQDKDTYEYSQLVETPVNLKGLLEKLQGQISKQWYQLGLTLGLPMDVLEGFNLYSEDDCLAEVKIQVMYTMTVMMYNIITSTWHCMANSKHA